MRAVRRIVPLLRSLFRGARVDADLAEELRFHIERETEANVARGMSSERARRAARLTFGSIDVAQETSRDDRPGASGRQVARDIRFGARLLAKAPAFGVAGVTIVALGIGAVTAIFSVVYGVLLRPLPFREPQRLVSIWTTPRTLGRGRMYPAAADAREWRESNHVFDDIALVRSSAANLTVIAGGEAERLQGARVSPNLFSVLGVSAALGRTFAVDEDQVGHEQVVLLSHALWQRRFGGDRSVVGRGMQLNGLPYTIVGVMPPDFQYPSPEFHVWIPIVIDPLELSRQVTQNYRAVARLTPTATVEQARADLEAIAKRMEAAYPAGSRALGVSVDSMLRDAVSAVRPALIVLLGAVSCLLLIACLNLSNLLGARAAARGGEFALRLALGASRRRLVAQAIAEVTPILALGGLLGVAAAAWGVRAFVATAPVGMPRLESIGLSAPVIIGSMMILIFTGVVASLMPAITAWRSDFTAATKVGSRFSAGGRPHSAGRRIGVAVQIAFAVPLLVGASLLIRSSLKLANVDLGFRPNGVATFNLSVPRTKYQSDMQVAAFFQRLVQAVANVPGVAHAGMVNRLPLAGGQTMSSSARTTRGDTVELSSIDSRPVTPDYFAALGIAVLRGRSFTDHDDVNAPAVSVVDDRLARAVWPGESALGKHVRRPDGAWSTIIGVVAHIHTEGLDVDARPQVYWSYGQLTPDRMVLVVRGAGEPAALIAPVLLAIRSVDPEQSVYDVRTMTAVVGRSLAQRRLTMTLIGAFGGIALLLAAVGVYGVVSYGVTQRLREFGIRVALGATRRDVTRLVVRQGLSTAIVGAAIGLVVALALAGAMSSLVFGVAPRDLISLAAATLTLLTVAAVASYIPARRASAVDPALTLRAE